MSYDAWLEKPYQDRAASDDAYFQWCEDNDLDPSDDHEAEFEQAMDDAREDAELARAENRADMERERDYDY